MTITRYEIRIHRNNFGFFNTYASGLTSMEACKDALQIASEQHSCDVDELSVIRVREMETTR